MAAMEWCSADHEPERPHSIARLRQRFEQYASGVFSLSSTSVTNESVGRHETFEFLEPIHDDFEWNQRALGRDGFEHQKPSIDW